MHQCPMCRSDSVKGIIWGLTAEEPDGFFLGGCCPPPGDPTHYCEGCRSMFIEVGHRLEFVPIDEGDEQESASLVSPDLAAGVLLGDLLGPDDDKRTVDEVLAGIDAVLGLVGEDPIPHCCSSDQTCSVHYDLGSQRIAGSWIRGRSSNSLVISWTVDAFVSLRAEVWNADEAIKSEVEWFEEHDFDENEQNHVWLICADDCPICLASPRYVTRMKRSFFG